MWPNQTLEEFQEGEYSIRKQFTQDAVKKRKHRIYYIGVLEKDK